MIETFTKDSPFITSDTRNSRWAVPYHYEALNSRVENLVINQREITRRKNILDLGCHFGTFAYACLTHGADFVQGVDSEKPLIEKARELFSKYSIDETRYSFTVMNIIDYLEKIPDDSYDTILCLGLLYYLPDIYHALDLMKRKAREHILIDTFTAYYGACMTKEGVKFQENISDEAYNLPVVLHPLTQAEKKDYTLNRFFKNRKNKPISMLSLPTIPALENFFRLMNCAYERISWQSYVINRYTWKDFTRSGMKKASHWADVYHTGLRVSYLIEVKKND